jgi:hypothetical protein
LRISNFKFEFGILNSTYEMGERREVEVNALELCTQD